MTEEGRRLLYTALCDPDLSRVEDNFEAAGYEFKRYYPTRKIGQGSFAQFFGPGSGKGVGFGYYPTGRGEVSESGFAMGSHGEGFGFPMGSKNGMLRKVEKTSGMFSWASRSRTESGQRGSVPPAFGGYEDHYEDLDDSSDGFGGVSRHPDGLRGGEKTRVETVNNQGNNLKDAKPDRRLPFAHARGLGDLNSGILADAAEEVAALDLDQHLEYLGECLVRINPGDVMLKMKISLTIRSVDISNVSGLGS
jgi:hypothetical protein